MTRASRLRTICLVALLGALLAFPLVQIVRAGERLTIVPNLEVDSRDYDAIALNLSQHRSLDAFSPVFPPGFVAIIAVVYATVGHSLVAAKTVLWLCLVFATVVAGLLARRVHGAEAAGWTAAFLTASSPALQAYTGTLQYEVLVSALILMLIVIALWAANTDWPSALLGRALLLGLALGTAALIREPLIVLIPVFGLFVAHQARATQRLALAAGVSAVVVAAVISLGWSVLQSRHAGHTMLIRDNLPGILPFGHNPYANGTFNVSLAGVGQPAGIPFILSEPRRELWLLGRKAMYFWGVLRDGWNVPRPAAVWAARASGGLLPLDIALAAARGGWLLLAFIVACGALRREQWRTFWLLPAVVAAMMLVYLVTIASHRFAVPVLPVVYVIIAGVIARMIVRVNTAGAAVIVLLAVAGVAMQAGQWPIAYRLQPAELDGVNGENRREPDGRLVRFVDAGRGRRVAFALYDEYLPGGPLLLRVLAKRGPGSVPAATPVARLRLFALDGSAPCDVLVTSDQLDPPDHWTQFGVSCTLAHDGVARLIMDTFGRVDLSFADVTLQWRRSDG
jgi:4-amino-4-deoxy-L-arabinose transferase-like glycosyltransferase